MMPERIAFRLAGGAQPLVVFPVRVNGQGPYDFVLDTGAGTTLLSTGLARRLGIEATQTKEAQTAGGKVTVSLGSVALLEAGGANVRDVGVAMMDLSDLERAVGQKIDGDLGYNFLQHFRLTIDYRERTLRLLRGRYESVGVAAAQEVDFKLAHPAKPLILVEAVINGMERCELVIDTGCSTTMLAPDFAARLNLTGTPIPPVTTGGGHQISAAAGKLGSLTVGPAQAQNVAVVIADAFGMLGQALGVSLCGIIGYNFLKEFALTVDYPNGKVLLSR